MIDPGRVAYLSVGVAVALGWIIYDRVRPPPRDPWQSEESDAVRRWLTYALTVVIWPWFVVVMMLVARDGLNAKYRYQRQNAPIALRWLIRRRISN